MGRWDNTAGSLTQRFQDQVDEVDSLVLQPLVGLHRHVQVPITLLVAHVDRDPCVERLSECWPAGRGSQSPDGRCELQSYWYPP